MARTWAWFGCALVALSSGSCGGKTLEIGGSSDDGAGDGDGKRGLDGGNGVGGNVGTQSTVLVPRHRGANSLYLHRSYLYWNAVVTTNPELRRCQPQNCLETLETIWEPAAGVIFRGDNMYISVVDGIASCPVSGCVAPTVVVAIRSAASSLAVVDDSRIYWHSRQDSAVFSCPVSGCSQPEKAVVTGIHAYAMVADETHLYWTSMDNVPLHTFSINSAPKDGSASPKILAGAVKSPASFTIHGGYVYWATSEPKGQVARCPTSGCSNSGPEVLASNQKYPRYLAVNRDALFWLTETPTGNVNQIERPTYVVGCTLPDCAGSRAVLDEAMGGSYYPLQSVLTHAPNLAVGDDAIYYIGDVTAVPPEGGTVVVAASIRRLPRKTTAP